MSEPTQSSNPPTNQPPPSSIAVNNAANCYCNNYSCGEVVVCSSEVLWAPSGRPSDAVLWHPHYCNSGSSCGRTIVPSFFRALPVLYAADVDSVVSSAAAAKATVDTSLTTTACSQRLMESEEYWRTFVSEFHTATQ